MASGNIGNNYPLSPSPSGVYSFKWNSFQNHLAKGLKQLFDEHAYTDVTLACDGQYLRAHKFFLSLCSPFFKKLFEVNTKGGNDTIVILNNVRFKDLESIIQFIYNGQANVNNADLPNFLQTGELLQIQGLAAPSSESNEEDEGRYGQKNANITLVPSQRPSSSQARTHSRAGKVLNKTSTACVSTTTDSRFMPSIPITTSTTSHMGQSYTTDDSPGLIDNSSIEVDPLQINANEITNSDFDEKGCNVGSEEMISLVDIAQGEVKTEHYDYSGSQEFYHEPSDAVNANNWHEFLEGQGTSDSQRVSQGIAATVVASPGRRVDPHNRATSGFSNKPGRKAWNKGKKLNLNRIQKIPTSRLCRSKVWNHFKKCIVAQESGDRLEVAQCIYCPTGTGQYKHNKKCNQSTGNMKTHMLKHHPDKPL